MNLKKTFGITIVSLLILVAAPAGCVLWQNDPWRLSAPSDEKLIELFKTRRSAFERLREMAVEDRFSPYRLQRDDLRAGMRDKTPMAKERMAEYANLIASIPGLNWVDSATNENARFNFARGGTFGVFTPEWAKGIDYISDLPPSKLSLSSNLNSSSGMPIGSYYHRIIDENWYIYVEIYD